MANIKNEEAVISNLLERYEAFKLKWLQINEQDMFDFLKLQDEIDDKVIELKSKYLEEDLTFKRDYGIKLNEIKSKKDFEGKKMFTDTMAKWICDAEFFDRELDLIVIKCTFENLANKSKKVVEYINVVKLALRKDFSI